MEKSIRGQNLVCEYHRLIGKYTRTSLNIGKEAPEVEEWIGSLSSNDFGELVCSVSNNFTRRHLTIIRNRKKQEKVKKAQEKIIIHVPHASTVIPEEGKNKLILDENYINHENIFMSDYLVDLFIPEEFKNVVKFPYSRMFCDVERYRDDSEEEMSIFGMGAVYERDSNRIKFINVDDDYKKNVLENYYDSHHRKLNDLVGKILEKHDKCLIIDLHSFSDEFVKKVLFKENNPDICVGVNKVYDEKMLKKIVNHFTENGYTVALNYPYSGAIIPEKYKDEEDKVSAVMIEINKRIYLDNNMYLNFEKFTRLKNSMKKLFEKIAR